MAEGDIGAVLGTLEFDVAKGETPAIAHVAGGVYGIAYRDTNNHGKVIAVSISNDGLTLSLLAGTVEFEDTSTEYIHMIHVTGNVFAIVYEGPSAHGWIKTVTISDDGATIALAGGTLNYYANTAGKPKIIHIAGIVYAIVYEAYGYDGTIRAVSISADGATIALLAGVVVYDSVKGTRGKLIHISGTVYAVAYQGPDFDGWIRTVTISDNGSSITLLAGNLEFDVTYSAYADIVHISGNVYAVAYRDSSGHGKVVAVSISDNGLTLTLLAGTVEFDGAACEDTKIIPVSGNVYAIVYRGAVGDGFLKTVTISADGATITLIADVLEFDELNCDDPDVIYITGSIYAIAYSGDGADGFLRTVEIETITPGGVKHLMTVGVG